jgi:uncharacterized protein
MNPKALILHSWFGKINADWLPWIQKKLIAKHYQVFLSQIPTFDSNLPELNTSLSFINKQTKVDNNTLVIGHSLGCLLAMRLAEKKSFAKMILVAGWDYNDLTAEHQLFWKTKIKHDLIKKNVKEIIVVSSDNDPYVTQAISAEMCKRLNGKFVLVPGAGHFTEKYGVTKIPEILNYF